MRKSKISDNWHNVKITLMDKEINHVPIDVSRKNRRVIENYFLLEKYYNEYMFGVGMPVFEKLDNEQLQIIYRSLGFSKYRLNHYFKELGKGILQLFTFGKSSK